MLKKFICFVVIVVVVCVLDGLRRGSALFLAPITKHSSSAAATSSHKHYYYALNVYLETPPQQMQLAVDLGASAAWINNSTCDSSSTTSHHHHYVPKLYHGLLSLPLIANSGRNPGSLSPIPHFTFFCSTTTRPASGLAGFGRSSNLSLPSQITKLSHQPFVFALCLSGSPSAPGVAFFGTRGPYWFLPEIDLSKHLNFTPLLPATLDDEYLIGLEAIRINGKVVVQFTSNGFNARSKARLSTVNPYTVLESQMFKAVAEAFVNETDALLKLKPRDEPVSPFRVCYDADEMASGALGPEVPSIELVLEEEVVWKMVGWNSMVRMYSEDAWCLGLLEGGSELEGKGVGVVIGGHQMEDKFLQFDVDNQMLGFTSASVLEYGTMCANFNFTSQGLITTSC